jgi:hypothetical protein
MNRIKVSHKYNADLLIEHSDLLDRIGKELLVGFAHEMTSKKCFELTQSEVYNSAKWYGMPEREVMIEALVMKPSDFKEVIMLLHIIKSALPGEFRHYADNLHSLLTKETN